MVDVTKVTVQFSINKDFFELNFILSIFITELDFILSIFITSCFYC